MMDKDSKLSCVVAKLQQVAEFLHPYLPLANVHNSNFVVSNHWDHMIPESIGLELLQLDDYQLSVLPAGDLYCCKCGHGSMTNCSTKDISASVSSVEGTDTFSSRPDLTMSCSLNTECNIASFADMEDIAAISSDFIRAGDTSLNMKPSDDNTDISRNLARCYPGKLDMKCDSIIKSDYSPITNWQHQNLKDFIMMARSCTLPQLGVLTDVAELGRLLGLESLNTKSHIVVSHAMKIKKSHEVDVMSSFCAWLAKGFSISNVSICTDYRVGPHSEARQFHYLIYVLLLMLNLLICSRYN